MLSPEWNVAAAAVNLVGCISYAKDTLAGRTKPNRVGWGLWAAAPLIAFAAELSQGVGWQSLITLSSGLGPLMVLTISFATKKAYWKLRPFDWFCGGLSLIALVLWAVTGKGDVAILFSICADVFACLPTLTKAYHHPETERALTFWFGVVGTAISLLTIAHWTFANYAFPVYLLVANVVLASVIDIRRKWPGARA
ncbi:MAG TPA: hypothetical protein VLF71_00735 [Candidatus Saccharimonadales bacterium]|nr:hypothetical protein [Candidatus Saccharimonadales bacterium]